LQSASLPENVGLTVNFTFKFYFLPVKTLKDAITEESLKHFVETQQLWLFNQNLVLAMFECTFCPYVNLAIWHSPV